MTLAYDLREELREEIVLPDQFFSPARFKDKHRGAVALLCAILGDAIRCLQEGRWENGWNHVRAAREAKAWLFVDDYDWPFSFVNICEHLGLDPSYLRRGLERRRPLRQSMHRCEDPLFFHLDLLFNFEGMTKQRTLMKTSGMPL